VGYLRERNEGMAELPPALIRAQYRALATADTIFAVFKAAGYLDYIEGSPRIAPPSPPAQAF
jgi:hypothetical protein